MLRYWDWMPVQAFCLEPLSLEARADACLKGSELVGRKPVMTPCKVFAGIVLLKNRAVADGRSRLPLNPLLLRKVSHCLQLPPTYANANVTWHVMVHCV